MYLRRVEIFGFKSFADRINLELEPGITAIVGPNGVGKSNIVEALRWVLGEQSARELRGTRMEDVIFAGSDRRRPLGLAEVAVVLDNSDGTLPVDFGEVTLTRRVYRSGESEYLINGVPCRLKDISDLIMDTGLGREAYNFIHQGKVDDVLSARPEDRRSLLEEAAGITRYRLRKREALRRLEETDQHLLRVGDVIAELHAQFGPVEEQARLARQFQAYRTELDGLEIALYTAELATLGAEASRARQVVAQLQRQLAEAETRLEELDGQAEAARVRLGELDEALGARRRNLARAAQELEEARDLAATARARAARLEADTERQAALARELASEVETAATQAAAAEEALGVQEAALAAREAELAAAGDVRRREEAVLKDLEAKLAAERAATAALREEQARLEARRAALAEGARLRAARREELEGEARELASRQAAVGKRRAELGARAERLAAEGQAHRDGLAAAGGALDRGREEAAAARQAADAKWRELEGLLARQEALAEMDRALEGLEAGPRAVLAARHAGEEAFGGVVGVLGRLVQVEAGYERAVGAALGPLLDGLVVESPAAARRAAEAFAASGSGRVSFLVPPAGRHGRPPRAAASLREVVDPVAGDAALVVARLLDHLLGPVSVASDLAAAAAVVASLAAPLVVTTRGDALSAAGEVRVAGKDWDAGGVLSRRAEAERLGAAVEAARRQTDALAAAAEAAEGKLPALEAARVRAEAAVKQWELERARLAEEQRGLDREAEGLAARARSLDRTREDLDQADAAAAREAAGLEERAQAVAARLAEARARSGRLAEDAAAARARLEAATARFTEVHAALAATREKHQARRDAVDRFRQQWQALERRRAEAVRGAEEASLAAGEAQRMAEEAAADQRRAAELRQRLEAAVAGLEQERQQLAERLEALDREGRALRRRTGEWQRRLVEVEREVAHAEAHLGVLRRRLREDHGLTDEEMLAPRPPLEDPAAARARAEELRAAIAAMGEVNVGAIDEWQRVRERHDFLETQRRDLEESRASLRRVIAEMDTVMEAEFLRTADAVAAEFAAVFGEMFGGGRADLVLTDRARPLESGVEILAQPPGKILQHLSLLSGGERSLTAIALLFAILRVRPSPFCVLDEIDAALDDVNIRRFVRYLGERARDTQFLVVTHNKGTMEAAGVLYGVTMEEAGVSRLVSIRLADAQQQAS